MLEARLLANPFHELVLVLVLDSGIIHVKGVAFVVEDDPVQRLLNDDEGEPASIVGGMLGDRTSSICIGGA